MAIIDELNALVVQIDADANTIAVKEQALLDEIALLQSQLAAAITPAQADALKVALVTAEAKLATLANVIVPSA